MLSLPSFLGNMECIHLNLTFNLKQLSSVFSLVSFNIVLYSNYLKYSHRMKISLFLFSFKLWLVFIM